MQERRPQLEGIATFIVFHYLSGGSRKEDLNQKGLRRWRVSSYSTPQQQERRPQLEGIATQKCARCSIATGRKEDLNQKGLRPHLRLTSPSPSPQERRPQLEGIATFSFFSFSFSSAQERRPQLEGIATKSSLLLMTTRQERRPQLEGIATFNTFSFKSIIFRRKEDLNQKGLRLNFVVVIHVSPFVGKKTSIRRDCDSHETSKTGRHLLRRKEDLNQKGLRLPQLPHPVVQGVVQERRPQLEGIATSFVTGLKYTRLVGKKTSIRRDCDRVEKRTNREE